MLVCNKKKCYTVTAFTSSAFQVINSSLMLRLSNVH